MIHLVTPLYRYNNTPILQDPKVYHYAIKTQYIYGHEQRNYFLNNIETSDRDWCYFLDDDNIVTGDLVEVAQQYLDSNVDVILLAQKAGLTEKTRLYGLEGRLKLGLCDVGSVLLRCSLAKKCRFEYEFMRNADGHYAECIAQHSLPENQLYLNDKYVRYNSLSLEII